MSDRNEPLDWGEKRDINDAVPRTGLIRVAIYTGHNGRAAARRREVDSWLRAEPGFTVADSGADVVVLIGLELHDAPPTAAPAIYLSDGQETGWRPGLHANLPSDVTAAELYACVRAAAQNLTVLTGEQADRLLPRRQERLLEHLTARELQVLRLLADGFGNQEIALRLEISRHTAKFHVAQVLAKLGAGSRAEAVASGIRHGLISI